MNVEHDFIHSAQDGLRLGVLVMPVENPLGLVQIAHGMCEHKERYLPLMTSLAERGYASVIGDHRGHGESIRTEQDLGYFYENGAHALVEDMRQITDWFKRRYAPGTPFFLFGHSMGSLAVRVYAKRYDGELNGLFVCGCPGENPAAAAGEMLASLMTRVLGAHYRCRLITNMVFADYKRRFPGSASEHAWVCANEEIVRAYDADPLCNYIFTLNGYQNLFRLMRDAYDVKNWHTDHAQMPVRFISGANDPCMVDKQHFESAMERMRAAGYEQVSGKLYEGLRHEIHNEKCAPEIFRDIADTLDQWRR